MLTSDIIKIATDKTNDRLMKKFNKDDVCYIEIDDDMIVLDGVFTVSDLELILKEVNDLAIANVIKDAEAEEQKHKQEELQKQNAKAKRDAKKKEHELAKLLELKQKYEISDKTIVNKVKDNVL